MDAAASGGFFPPDEKPAAYGEVVWSWRRDPGVKPMERSIGDGGKKGRSPGRARISRKTIARGKPGCLGCTCLTRVLSFASSRTRCCGRSQRPAFPAPSLRKRADEMARPERKRAAGTLLVV